MKKLGRKHRPFFRICAIDGRSPRDGRVLEELGTYDPMIDDTDARALLKADRVQYWLGVGAQPSQKVKTLIKKYGAEGTHLEQQAAAREKLAMPKVVPDAGAPAYVPPAEGEEPAAEAAPAAAGEAPAAEAASTESAPAEAAAEEAPAEQAAGGDGASDSASDEGAGEKSEETASVKE
ncbi:MAG: 30S ribosomal protein S16 [Planctomycetota bacterium]|nr:MAG: 30S ribosomal protein S16 [Planctomycetota bacterium]